MNSTIPFGKINTTETKLHFFEIIAIIFFSAYYILPSVSASFSETFFVLLALIYVAYVFLLQPPQNGYILSYLLCALWISAMYFLLTTTSTIDASVENLAMKQFMSKFFQYFLMFFPLILTIRVVTKASATQIKYLLGIISAMILFVVIVTLRELQINPNIIRSWYSTTEATYNNVASYYFVYAIPILISIIVLAIFKFEKRKYKILGVILTLFFLFFLLQAQYTLSILIAMIVIVLAFLKASNSTPVKVISVIILFFTLFFFVDIFNFLASHVRSAQISLRLRELANFFSIGDASGYNLNSRMTLYWQTIKAFFTSPLYGHSSLDFDGHATFLTILADTGLLGGIPFYFLYFMSYKKILSLTQDTELLFSIPFIALALTGLTNPIHASYPVGFVLWFVCPLVILALKPTTTQEVKQIEKLEN